MVFPYSQQVCPSALSSDFYAARSLALFGALHRAGCLRVDQATEIAGIDNIDHRGPAYPDFVIASHD